jgi:biotin carboxylase
MEEFLDGREVSIETFSFGGSHVIIAVTDKWTLSNFIEVGHAVPALLDEGELRAVERCVASFLDVVGLMDGPAHTEIKLTSAGPRIVESHNRIGGDRINKLVKVAYGVDMVSMTYAWAFGLCEPIRASPIARAAAAIRFIVPKAGLIRSISGAEQVRRNPAVVELEIEKQIGDRVNHVADSDDRCGYLLVEAANRDAAVELSKSLSESIAVDVLA